MSGSTKAWAVLSVLSVILVVSFQSWGGRQGLLWGVIIVLSINCVLYFFNEIRLEKLFSGQLIEGQNPWNLFELTEKLAQKARIPVPKILVISSSSPQAIAMGRNWNSATILLTDGLLNTLSPQEREAVISYQIACIKKLDTLIFSLTSALTSFIFFMSQLGDLLLRGVLGSKEDPRSRQNHLISFFVTPFATGLVRMTIGTRRYLALDTLAASWIDDPQYLAQALWKMESYAATKPIDIPPYAAPLFIVNPLTLPGWTRYFQVHPHIELRIKNIIGYFPI